MQVFLMLKYTIYSSRTFLWLKSNLIVPAFLNQDSPRELSSTVRGHRLYIMNLLLASASRMVLVMNHPWEDWGNSHSNQFLYSVVQMRNFSWESWWTKGHLYLRTAEENLLSVGPLSVGEGGSTQGYLCLIFFGHYLGQYFSESAKSTGMTKFVRS